MRSAVILIHLFTAIAAADPCSYTKTPQAIGISYDGILSHCSDQDARPCYIGEKIEFTATLPADFNPVTCDLFKWWWSDGVGAHTQPDGSLGPPETVGMHGSHTFTATGKYTAVLDLNDRHGGTAVLDLEVTDPPGPRRRSARH